MSDTDIVFSASRFDSFLRRTFPDKYKKQRIRPQVRSNFVPSYAPSTQCSVPTYRMAASPRLAAGVLT
eukprot:2552845-Rhodomonas_salina.1